MPALRTLTTALRRDRRGTTALEYGIIAGGIFLAITVAVGIYADHMQSLYTSVITGVSQLL